MQIHFHERACQETVTPTTILQCYRVPTAPSIRGKCTNNGTRALFGITWEAQWTVNDSMSHYFLVSKFKMLEILIFEISDLNCIRIDYLCAWVASEREKKVVVHWNTCSSTWILTCSILVTQDNDYECMSFAIRAPNYAGIDYLYNASRLDGRMRRV